MNKKFKYFFLAGATLTMLFVTGCVSQTPVDNNKTVVENSETANSSNWFETRQAISLNKNTYEILKFANEDVSYDIEAGNKFYSSKDAIAITAEIYEGEDLSFEEVITTSMEYIQNNIVSQEVVSEDDSMIYYHIEYDILGESKFKEVVCMKTKTGILLHDLTYFEPINAAEEATIKPIIDEFLSAI